MQIRLFAVPPGGGESEYCLDVECPAIPAAGDYVTVMREHERRPVAEEDIGTEDFIVRRVRWSFHYPDDGETICEEGEGPVGQIAAIEVECEKAIGAFSCRAHREGAGKNARLHE